MGARSGGGGGAGMGSRSGGGVPNYAKGQDKKTQDFWAKIAARRKELEGVPRDWSGKPIFKTK